MPKRMPMYTSKHRYLNNIVKYIGNASAVQSMANHYAHFIEADDLRIMYRRMAMPAVGGISPC